MNQTEQLFGTILAFGVGWAIAYVFKNFTKIIERFGYLLCYVIGLPVIMVLLMAAAMISDYQNLLLSLVFLAGFVLGMVQRHG